MERGYSIIDHPSDLGIEARGESLRDAFEEAARALMALIVDPTVVQETEPMNITIDSDDLEQLLVKWLSEILYLYDGAHFVSKGFTIHELTPTGLRADILGEPFSAENHQTRTDIKAVTYHQISIAESPRGTVVRVYLDI